MLDKVRGKHYQLACGLAFEGITGAQQETGINKPSEYYAASIDLEKQRAAAAAEGQQQQQQQQGALGGSGAVGGVAAGGGGPPPSTPLAGSAPAPMES